jgi:hypothetical protein
MTRPDAYAELRAAITTGRLQPCQRQMLTSSNALAS